MSALIGPRELPLLSLGSGWRIRPVAQTWATARQLMPALGISRVTDVTRLDRLGLPVFASVRPRGHVLRVHAGKGLNADEARLGALMEAIENAIAELPSPPASIADLSALDIARGLGDGLQFIDLAPRFGVAVDPGRRIPAVACEDIGRGRTCWVPAELIHVPFEPADGVSLFGWTTNGLASGNSVEEATLHALFEVLERDVLAMHAARDESEWIDLDTLPEPFRSLAVQWQGLGVQLSVRHLPNAWGLPCIEACLHEPGSTAVNLICGAGLHLDRRVALTRAITEAAQCRITLIHGGREDVTRYFEKYTEWTPEFRDIAEARIVASRFSRDRRIAFSQLPHEGPGATSLPSVLSTLLERLSDAGFSAVLRHQFPAVSPGLSVVKLVVPRCEQMECGSQRLGPRLKARICEAA